MILASTSDWTLLLTMLTACGYALPALTVSHWGEHRARQCLMLTGLLHLLTLSAGLWGVEPRFGFAPALSVTAWLVLATYVVESQFFPQLKLRWALASLGAVAVLAAWFFPGKPLHTLASGWLPLHWALGIASYGMFGAAVFHAALMSHTERQIRLAYEGASGLPLMTLERLTFRFVNVGFILLSATLLAGFFFSETLYGSAGANWKWDHKTIFSLMAWFTFAMLLMGRSRLGWRGKRAVRMLYIGSGLLLLAYVGSRFVLEVLLERSSG
jgi:ABC-type uncharacterized transport system permease subunit